MTLEAAGVESYLMNELVPTGRSMSVTLDFDENDVETYRWRKIDAERKAKTAKTPAERASWAAWAVVFGLIMVSINAVLS